MHTDGFNDSGIYYAFYSSLAIQQRGGGMYILFETNEPADAHWISVDKHCPCDFPDCKCIGTTHPSKFVGQIIKRDLYNDYTKTVGIDTSRVCYPGLNAPMPNDKSNGFCMNPNKPNPFYKPDYSNPSVYNPNNFKFTNPPDSSINQKNDPMFD